MGPLRYVPFDELGTAPNIIVDGAANDHTVLTLSHWPKSGTPRELKRDTSTEIVVEFLKSGGPEAHGIAAECVSNNHFDEDGLFGVWALLHPDLALDWSDFFADCARAGDFGVYGAEAAIQVVMAIAAMARDSDEPYLTLLPQLEDLVRHTERYEAWWRVDFDELKASEAALVRGTATIEERTDLDLAIFRSAAPLHEVSENTATERFRVLDIVGSTYELRFRYETWVQYISRRPMPRVDMGPLVPVLHRREHGAGRWKFDGIADIIPKLYLRGADGLATPSTIPEEEFVALVTGYLERSAGDPTLWWDPWDERPIRAG